MAESSLNEWGVFMAAMQLIRGKSLSHFTGQLFRFAWLQSLSCIFAATVFITLALSKLVDIPYLYRYDLILLVLLTAQVLMYAFKLETWDEIKVICLFHLLGLALELFKVHMGSWSYPEPALTKIFGVPLYSGFMYASVASYLCQAWRRLELHIDHWPQGWLPAILGTAIYANFFTHHLLPDVRWWLTAAVLLVFIRTWVRFTVGSRQYRMPLTLSFILIGFFIWVAENIATFFGAWQYPDQAEAWRLVGFGKISSWFLLVIISIILVAQLKRTKAYSRSVRRLSFQKSAVSIRSTHSLSSAVKGTPSKATSLSRKKRRKLIGADGLSNEDSTCSK